MTKEGGRKVAKEGGKVTKEGGRKVAKEGEK